MTGWFEFLDARAAELDAAARRAAEVAAQDDWLEVAWSEAVGDPAFVRALYGARRERDALADAALRRLEAGGVSHRWLCSDPEAAPSRQILGPFVVALAAKRDALRSVIQFLASGCDLGRPVAPLLDQGDATEAALAFGLAASPHAADRDLARRLSERLDADGQRTVAIHLGLAGDERAAPSLLEALEEVALFWQERTARLFAGERVEHPHGGRSADTLWGLVRALAKVPLDDDARATARMHLTAMVRTDDALPALWGLAQVTAPGDPVDEVAALHRSLAGHRHETAPLRQAAALVLLRAQHDDPDLPQRALDDVRYVRAHMHPERYGYPKVDDLIYLDRIGAEVTLASSAATDDDLAITRALSTHVAQWLREVGLEAGGVTPRFFDAIAARALLEALPEAEGPDALFAALDDPATTFPETILAVLAEHEDAAVQERAARWCRAQLEAVPNTKASYYGDLEEPMASQLKFLRDVPDDEQKQAWLGDSSSAWIAAMILDGEDMPSAPREEEHGEATVRAFDAPAFTLGKNVNGLALSPDGALLLAVGEETVRLLDARTGAALRSFELRWRWAYDCAFTPDGAHAMVCFHGGHVELYEVATGERVLECVGHGGVPNGTRCLAIAPDGSFAVTGGGDGRLIAWDLRDLEQASVRWTIEGGPGTYQDVVFRPDGRVLASHVASGGGEKNFLEIIDPATGESERFPTELSMWSLAYREADGWLAMGGESKFVTYGPEGEGADRFALPHRVEQRKAVQLRFVGDALHCASENGDWTVWSDLEGSPSSTTLVDGKSLWAMATDGERVFVAGRAGEVLQAAGGALVPPSAPAHGKRVKVLLPGDAEQPTITADWDGQVIVWSDPPRTLVELGVTVESGARVPGTNQLILGTRKGLRLIDATTGEVVAQTEERADEVVPLDAARIAHRVGDHVGFAALPSLAPEGEPVAIGTDTINALALVPGEGVLTGNEHGQVCFVATARAAEDGAPVRTWARADHGADRLSRGGSHRDVASIAWDPVARRFASAATDHMVRVYDFDAPPDAPPILRIATGFGLFNQIAFSPDGSLLTVPSSWALEVYAVPSGTRLCRLGAVSRFDSHSIAGCVFTGARSLLVGCDDGRLFEVDLQAESEVQG